MGELILTTAAGGQFWVDYYDTTDEENFNVFYFENASDECPEANALDVADWVDAVDQMAGYCPKEALSELWAKVHPLPDHVETDTGAFDIFDGEAIRFSGTASYNRNLLPAFNFDVFIPLHAEGLGAHYVVADWCKVPEHLAFSGETLTNFLEEKVKAAADFKAFEFIEMNRREYRESFDSLGDDLSTVADDVTGAYICAQYVKDEEILALTRDLDQLLNRADELRRQINDRVTNHWGE